GATALCEGPDFHLCIAGRRIVAWDASFNPWKDLFSPNGEVWSGAQIVRSDTSPGAMAGRIKTAEWFGNPPEKWSAYEFGHSKPARLTSSETVSERRRCRSAPRCSSLRFGESKPYFVPSSSSSSASSADDLEEFRPAERTLWADAVKGGNTTEQGAAGEGVDPKIQSCLSAFSPCEEYLVAWTASEVLLYQIDVTKFRVQMHQLSALPAWAQCLWPITAPPGDGRIDRGPKPDGAAPQGGPGDVEDVAMKPVR
ncbi:unnamed protein product, partial [Amoebophrya sp. A120]